MNYNEYKAQIVEREQQGLHAKPIDDGDLMKEIIAQIKDDSSPDREDSLRHLIYNTVPGTTDAATEKSSFLKDIATGDVKSSEINQDFALELLEHMRGGSAVDRLVELLENDKIGEKAASHLSNMVFLYDDHFDKLKNLHELGNSNATAVLESYTKGEFFTRLPEVPEKIETVLYVVQEGDITTDLLSPGSEAGSRSDRELHSTFTISKKAQEEIKALKKDNPDKHVMMAASNGTFGTGSSRMSGVNNVAFHTGEQISEYIPFVNKLPIVAGTNGVAPIFQTTIDVTGGIGLKLPVEEFKTGNILTINTEDKNVSVKGEEITDISKNLGSQTMEYIRAGGSYPVVFGKKVQAKASEILGKDKEKVFEPLETKTIEGQGLNAAEKIMSANAKEHSEGSKFHAGSTLVVKVSTVGSQDTTGPLTKQELEAMSANKVDPSIASYQSFCHTAAKRDPKTVEANKELAEFMQNFGVISGRGKNKDDPVSTDVIHKVLDVITVDDAGVTIGGDSHTRTAKGLAFGADSGTVALALANGEVTMQIPESVKVTFEGKLPEGIDFRDVVSNVQKQMLEKYKGENVFKDRILEMHLGNLPASEAFTMTDWTAEMKAKAAINIMDDPTLIQSIETSKERIQNMIDGGFDNEKGVLARLMQKADERIEQIQSGEKPSIKPDADAKYAAEITINLSKINEPHIVDPDVYNDDKSKRYTHDTIKPLSDYKDKKTDFGFIGSCMVNIGDFKTAADIIRKVEEKGEEVEFKVPLVIAPPEQNIIDELKKSGDWDMFQKHAVYQSDSSNPRTKARTEFENGIYLEESGCNLCMGNQDKAKPGSTVLTTSTRLFEGRIVKDDGDTKGESLISSAPVVMISSLLGKIPSIDEYNEKMEGVKQQTYTPPEELLVSNRDEIKSIDITDISTNKQRSSK